MKYAACRYCIISDSDEFWCLLLFFSLCVYVGDALSCAVSGIFHNPLLLSIDPWVIIFTIHLIVTYCSLTHLWIHNHIVFQLRQMIFLWYWVWCGPHVLLLVRLGNIVNMDCLIWWFVHLVIPHEWVILCLLVVDFVHQIENNFLLPLYWVFLFIFIF